MTDQMVGMLLNVAINTTENVVLQKRMIKGKKKNKQNTFHSKQIIGFNQTHQPIKTHVPVG